METEKITAAEAKITKELNNLYRYSTTTMGKAPKQGHPLFAKYSQVNNLLAELSKTDYTEATLLQLRYLDGMSWEQVAAELSYSERNLFVIRKKAISLLTLKALKEKEDNQ